MKLQEYVWFSLSLHFGQRGMKDGENYSQVGTDQSLQMLISTTVHLTFTDFQANPVINSFIFSIFPELLGYGFNLLCDLDYVCLSVMILNVKCNLFRLSSGEMCKN